MLRGPLHVSTGDDCGAGTQLNLLTLAQVCEVGLTCEL